MTDWPFDGLQRRAYGCILADPPWLFKNRSTKGEKKNANQHYLYMSIRDMQRLPVADLAHPDGCALMLWATSPLLDQQMETLKGWGFAYKAAGGWGKRSKTGRKWAFGPGYIQRSTMEFWLIGTIGDPKRVSRSVRNFMEAPIREHSRKPDQMRLDCEALWPGPRCELFARASAPGWDTWGFERTKFDAQETQLAA